MTDEMERTLDAESKNGVYLLSIDKNRVGYTVKSGTDYAVVSEVRINGNHASIDDYFETECDAFEIDDRGTLNLLYFWGDDG